MNTSIELLSSMSPRVNKNRKIIKKAPTILALKKYFRKSLAFENAENAVRDESIITIETSSSSSITGTGSSSEAYKPLNATPIVISDSETSFTENRTPPKKSSQVLNNKEYLITPHTQTPSLSNDKYNNIQHWVDDVNSAKEDVSVFTEVSVILPGDNERFKCPKTNVAASSTLLETDFKRFDQFFTKMSPGKSSSLQKSCKSSKFKEINDSLITDDLDVDNGLKNISVITDDLDVDNNLKNISLHDALDLNFDESLNTRIRNNELNQNTKPIQGSEDNLTPEKTKEYENLLDDLYGHSWRAKKDDILPSSEPRVKVTKAVTEKAPNTARPSKKTSEKIHSNNSNLLNTLQKARFKRTLESPWTESLRRICDSDTESEEEKNDRVLPHLRLNFEDEDSDGQEHREKTNLKNKVPAKSTKEKSLKDKNTKEQSVKHTSTKNKTYTFLESLSGNVPIEKADLSALIFRKNFQQHKVALASKLFNLYNEKVFDGSIPKDTVIEWGERLRGTAGMCSCKKITRRTGAIERTVKIILSTKVLDSADRVRDTLLHEMCHAATWIVNEVSDGHGSYWKSWARRAMKTFPELPPINRCHNYVINTKYTYKCTGCGYSVGRHTKSLDTNKKRCGYCFGTFEVLINKTTKQGETKSVPATPKKPTAFALFVKENYANFKTPNLRHGDVMKILGQNFANMKINKA